MGKKCLIIAEAGVNHNGRLDLALELCDVVKKSGADVIKFQTWITDEIITRSVAQAEYQKQNTGVIESQYDMLKRLELSFDDFRIIKEHCDKIGLAFASTADDRKSLDFLIDLGIPFIKVGSGDIGNVTFLRYIGSKKLPVILSTGMSSIGDVELSVDSLRKGGAKDITLLHCTTNYPCPLNEVNLKAMFTLKEHFDLPIGYSDHTRGIEVPLAAVAMGAVALEKHFTLDRNMDGPDHLASMDPKEFGSMVECIRRIESSLGDGIKRMTDSEHEIKKVVTKRIVASDQIRTGEKLTEKNLTVKRNDIGALASEWDCLIGKTSKTDIKIDQGITVDMIR